MIRSGKGIEYFTEWQGLVHEILLTCFLIQTISFMHSKNWGFCSASLETWQHAYPDVSKVVTHIYMNQAITQEIIPVVILQMGRSYSGNQE
jgi:hypothetical protein